MVGVTSLGSARKQGRADAEVRHHAARGRPLTCSRDVRLMWPQTNELPDSSPLVPVAQEWSVDLNRTLSRKEKKKNADGVTLMGINQTGDQASQNKPSRWALGTSVPGKAPQVLCRGWNTPTRGDSPKGPFREPRGIFPDTAGQQPRTSLGRIFISFSARAVERFGEGAFAPEHFGPLVMERTDARCCPLCPQRCTRAGEGDWGASFMCSQGPWPGLYLLSCAIRRCLIQGWGTHCPVPPSSKYPCCYF